MMTTTNPCSPARDYVMPLCGMLFGFFVESLLDRAFLFEIMHRISGWQCRWHGCAGCAAMPAAFSAQAGTAAGSAQPAARRLAADGAVDPPTKKK